jgi:hypothetical protein
VTTIARAGLHFGMVEDARVGGFAVLAGRMEPGLQGPLEAKLKHAFETGTPSYEFVGGEARHKLEWTERFHERLRLQAFKQTMGGTAGAAVWMYGRPLAKRAVAFMERLRTSEPDQP